MKTNVICADFQAVPFPKHYLEGRVIEPIDVIESWALNHHLACALKYISRAGRKDSEKDDIHKAIWYLGRFIRRGTRSTEAIYIACPRRFDPFDVAQDWRLSVELSMALEHLYFSTKERPVYHVEAAIKFLTHRLKQLNKKRKNK